MTKLRISATLSLPLDALMKKHVILGQSGTGKTNAGVVLVEEFAHAELPFVVIDGLGVWWGLRSSRDGKQAGLNVFILGGEHGDMPLEPTAGAVVADFIVRSGHSFVLDLSHMRRAHQTTFMLAFCERIFESKAKNKSPLHLMVDEADQYAPQVTSEGGNIPKLAGAMEDLVRRGRSRGIGMTMITQRPQVLNKSLISQADVLHIFRLASPQDRKALDEWVKAKATKAQNELFTRELPELPVGHCFIWSPAWLDIFKRIHVRERETFDSSATPEVGVRALKPKVMTRVDIAGLKSAIAQTIEVSKAEDPEILRARIRELEAQLKSQKTKEKIVEKRVEVPVVPPALVNATKKAAETIRRAMSDIEEALAAAQTKAPTPTVIIGSALGAKTISTREEALAAGMPWIDPPPVRIFKARVVAPRADGESSLRKGERELLETLGRHHPVRMTRGQLATLAGFTVTGGTFRTYMSTLRREGLLVEESGNQVALSAAGIARAGVGSSKPMTREEVIERWRKALRKGERDLLDQVLTHGQLGRAGLAELTNMEASGGTFRTYLSTLKRNGLVAVNGDTVELGEALSKAS